MIELPTPEAETEMLEVYDLIEHLLSPKESIYDTNTAISKAVEMALRGLYMKGVNAGKLSKPTIKTAHYAR